MKLKLLITAILLSLALTATADLIVREQAYEVALADMRLPQSENGTIAFKTCSDCTYKTERVTVETVWMVNDRAVPLAKFRNAVRRVEDRAMKAVTVLHHVEQDRITLVAINL